MKYRRKRTAPSGGKALIFGLAVSSALFLLLMLLSAVISARTADPTGSVGMTSFFAFVISGAISGFVSAKKCGKDSIKIPMLSALSFVLILFLTGLVLSGGRLKSVTLLNIICYVAVFWLFSLLGKKPRRKRR